MQVFFEDSEESPGAAGMGIAPGRFRRFPSDLPVPQLGWNTVRPDAAERSSAGYKPKGLLDSAERSSAGEGLCHGLEDCRILDLPAPDPARAQHEFEVVERGQSIPRGIDRLDQAAPKIVDEKHDVGQLESRAAANTHARGQALDDRALAGADEGGGVGAVAVGLEVDCED